MKANLRLPPGIVDRLAGESDRKRALRLRRHIITADKGGARELPDETKELLAAVDDDASGDDERHDLRWCQHQSVWHVLEKTNIHHQDQPELWSPTRALAIADAQAGNLRPLIRQLPDAAEHVARYKQGWKRKDFPDMGQGVWHGGLNKFRTFAEDQAAAGLGDAEYAIRKLSEWALIWGSQLVWAGLHPDTTNVRDLAIDLIDAVNRYKIGRGCFDPFSTAKIADHPSSESFNGVGIHLDLAIQCYGLDVENPAGVEVLFPKARRLGWRKPRTSATMLMPVGITGGQ